MCNDYGNLVYLYNVIKHFYSDEPVSMLGAIYDMLTIACYVCGNKDYEYDFEWENTPDGINSGLGYIRNAAEYYIRNCSSQSARCDWRNLFIIMADIVCGVYCGD